MAYKALIFGTDDIYSKLKPFYDAEVERGNLDIVATVDVIGDDINLVYTDGRRGGVEDIDDFDIAIICCSNKDFYSRMKQLEAMGVLRDKIIDGRVFRVPNLDFPRLIKEGIAYGIFTPPRFEDVTFCIYPRVFSDGRTTVKFAAKTYVISSVIDGIGEVSFGKYCSVARNNKFDFVRTRDHNYNGFTTYALNCVDWSVPRQYYLPGGILKTNIGNDVWIGRRCTFKSLNPAKPLVIGDGAIIAPDSVVVKSVPPYAIVGGNPAQIIKYRFEPHIIDALLRIKWWDWSLDKIHDNFKYFNDVEKFIALHDN